MEADDNKNGALVRCGWADDRGAGSVSVREFLQMVARNKHTYPQLELYTDSVRARMWRRGCTDGLRRSARCLGLWTTARSTK